MASTCAAPRYSSSGSGSKFSLVFCFVIYCFGVAVVGVQYVVSDSVLSIIKNKCNACNGCAKGVAPSPSPITASPIFASPVLASPISSSPLIGFSPISDLPISFSPFPQGEFVPKCANPCSLSECPFFPNADCVVGCGCTAEYLNFNIPVTDSCDCQDPPACVPAPGTISAPPTVCLIKLIRRGGGQCRILIHVCVCMSLTLKLQTPPTSPSECQSVTCPSDAAPLCQYIPFANCQDVPCENPVNCFVDPCQVNSCPTNPNAICISNYCDGCNAIFVDPATNEASFVFLPFFKKKKRKEKTATPTAR